MPYNEGLVNTFTAPAGSDMSGKLWYAVALAQDANNPVPGVHASIAVAAKAIAGVMQNNPVQGQAAEIQSTGATPVCISPNQAVIAGTTYLEVDVGGTLTPHVTGIIVAQAVESCASSANIQIITARLMTSNALEA